MKSTPAAFVSAENTESSAPSSGSDNASGSGKGNEAQTIFSFSSNSVEDTSPKDDDLGDGWIEVR